MSMQLVMIAPDTADMVGVIKEKGLQFAEKIRTKEVNASLYCVAMVFAPFYPQEGPSLEQIHHELKPWFIERGMMLGEFYPGNSKPSLHASDVTPMDCPVHALVIRTSSAHDFLFIENDESYSQAERDSMKHNIEDTLGRA